MVTGPSVAMRKFVTQRLRRVLRGMLFDIVVGRHDDETTGTITVDINLRASSIGVSGNGQGERGRLCCSLRPARLSWLQSELSLEPG